ncbi:FCD domain-containing protein [Streptomyces sp. M19]
MRGRGADRARRRRPAARGGPELDEVLAAQDRHARELDVFAFTDADQAFHQSIVASAGNALATRIYRSLGDRQRRMACHALRPRPQRLAVLVAEHTALAEAVTRRDVAGFRTLLRAHLDATHREFSRLEASA